MVLIIVELVPFIPMSIKGMLGVLFIVISSVKTGLKNALITAALYIMLQSANFILNINVDYEQVIVASLLGSGIYILTAFYLGSFAETIKRKNSELRTEIERRMSVEKELKKKLTLLKSLMDTIPSPIFFKDLECRYIGCNPAFEAVIGISGSELVGKTTDEIIHTELASIYQEKDMELLGRLGRQTYEEIVRFTDGSLRSIIFDKAIFTDEHNTPMGIVGVMTDITDKKESGKLKQSIMKNKQIMDKILEEDKMKTEFFSNISHELRTPLNVLLGSIQLMELYQIDDEVASSNAKRTRSIAIMKQNCYRLLKLVNNLIDTSKIDAKAFEIHLKNCNIVSTIEEITLSVADYIENKGINLVFDTDIEEKIMACDDDKIERILLNLLSNAIKCTPKGGRIFVNIYNNDDGLSITVEDNGIGIPENKQGLIFQRFCQVDEMFTRQYEGSGIGLSLVKSLVEMHGGTITFESKVGKGTSFRMNLPFKEVKEKAVQYMLPTKQAHIERINIEFSDIYSIRSS